MTPEQLDELERLAKAATPGPWVMNSDDDSYCGRYYGLFGGEKCVIPIDWNVQNYPAVHDEDAQFIAAANPQVVLELIQTLRNEIHDQEMYANNLTKMYMWASGNRISKPNTLPEEAIAICEAHYDGIIDALSEELQNAVAEIRRLRK